MITQVATVLSLTLCVLADGHEKAMSEQRVKQNFEEKNELSHIGDHKPEHHKEYAWSYPSYEFSYKVKDPHTHDYKGQHETRDGDHVKGEYWLTEPDGGKRTVTYHSNKHSGYEAVVHYSMPNHQNHYKTEEHHEGDKQDNGHGKDGRGNDGDRGRDGGKDKSRGQELGFENDRDRGVEKSQGNDERQGQPSYHKPMAYHSKVRHVAYGHFTIH